MGTEEAVLGLLGRFRKAMFSRMMMENEHKGNSWRRAGYEFMWKKFEEELAEYLENPTPDEIVDMANVLAMIWDIHSLGEVRT